MLEKPAVFLCYVGVFAACSAAGCSSKATGTGAGGQDAGGAGGLGDMSAPGGAGGQGGIAGAGGAAGNGAAGCPDAAPTCPTDGCSPGGSSPAAICTSAAWTCPGPPRDCIPAIATGPDGLPLGYARCQAGGLPTPEVCDDTSMVYHCPIAYATMTSCRCFVHDIDQDCPDAGATD